MRILLKHCKNSGSQHYGNTSMNVGYLSGTKNGAKGWNCGPCLMGLYLVFFVLLIIVLKITLYFLIIVLSTEVLISTRGSAQKKFFNALKPKIIFGRKGISAEKNKDCA